MKEVKSKTTAKKSSASKKNVVSTDEAPKITLVKDIKKPKVTVEEEFLEPEENKRLILFISIAIIIIIGIVIGLLVGCEPKEKQLDDIVPNDEIEDIVVEEVDEEEEKTVKKVVSKTTTESTRYTITYLYENETKSYTTNIKSGNLITEYLPSGYASCTYYSDSKYTNSVDFTKAPTKDTTIYMVCSLLEYTVNYIDSEDNILSSNIVTGENTYNYVVNSGDNYCAENTKFLGWSNSLNNVITNNEGETIELTSDLNLKAVCGATTVKYTNKIEGKETEEDSTIEEDIIVEEETTTEELTTEETILEESTETEGETAIGEETVVEEETNEIVLGYTQEEVDDYVLPEHPNDIGLDTPTYFVPVEEETETSKKVVSDETEELGESEIKLSDVTGKTPEWYIPQINDNVEEKEYIFTGWTKEEVNEETGETTDVPVEDDYKPSTEPDAENELNANWEMPVEDAIQEVEA